MSVELGNAGHVMARLRGIAERAANPELALLEEIPKLEEAEKAVFEALGGRYVDTGRVQRSLTETSSPDALRIVHGTELIFGSAVFYARFLTRHEEGGHHLGGSAVLVDGMEVMATGAGQRVLRKIVGGDE